MLTTIPLLKSKLTATGIHLLLNIITFIIFIIILRTMWYPEPYFTASGGWQGLKLVILIDIILGPVLTFTIFNKTKPKKELRNDLSIIILLQFSALIWGIHTVYQQRPIATTFWEDGFYTVSFSDVSNSFKQSTLDPLIKSPHLLYFINKPTSINGIKNLNKEITEKKLPPFQLINRFQSLSKNFEKIKSYSVDINEIIETNESMSEKLTKILTQTNTSLDQNLYIKLISRYQNIILVFSQKGQLLGYLKAPFKDDSQV